MFFPTLGLTEKPAGAQRTKGQLPLRGDCAHYSADHNDLLRETPTDSTLRHILFHFPSLRRPASRTRARALLTQRSLTHTLSDTERHTHRPSRERERERQTRHETIAETLGGSLVLLGQPTSNHGDAKEERKLRKKENSACMYMKDEEQTLLTHISFHCSANSQFTPDFSPLSFSSSSSSVSPRFVAQSLPSTAVSHIRIQRLLRPPALLPRRSRGGVGGTTLAALASHVTATMTQSLSPAQQDHSVHSLLRGPLATLLSVAPSVAEKPVRHGSAKRTHCYVVVTTGRCTDTYCISASPCTSLFYVLATHFSLDPVLPFLPTS